MSSTTSQEQENLLGSELGALEFDEDVQENERQQQEKQQARENRIRTGHDKKIVIAKKMNDDDDENDNNGDDDNNSKNNNNQQQQEQFTKEELERIAALTPEEREARWGFTHEELKAATKVVSVLFSNPHLFVGDQVLADTRLFTMVSRDRATKKNNKEAMKKMLLQEQKRKQQQKRAADLAALSKTKMKQERDEALKALLLPPTAEEDDEEDEAGPDEDGNVGREGKSSSSTPMVKRNLILTTFKNENDDKGEDDNKPGILNKAQSCHICHTKYRELHHYYYSLCPACAALNYSKRLQKRDLRGRKVLLTGCRIKIGYEIALSLLRCGATLIGTTRFVHDCINRFMQEKDYDEWKDRVHLFALDLRDLWMVEQFCSFLKKKFKTLFAIINNAAQTVARTIEYTESLRFFESQPIPEVRQSLMAKEDTVEWMSFFAQNSSLRIGHPLKLEHRPVIGENEEKKNNNNIEERNTSNNNDDEKEQNEDNTTKSPSMQLSIKKSFPRPIYDRYDLATESTDLRTKNSWTMNMHEVDGSEAAETMAINALAPFILNARLQPILEIADEENGFPAPGTKNTDEKRFIINVSAMEGQFYRFKQSTHPHTNMAKAALNMSARTSGADLATKGIFMNAVDTGWITDETPEGKRQRQWTGDKPPCPLDEVDAAARVLDLIYTNSSEHSKFWKDYREIPW